MGRNNYKEQFDEFIDNANIQVNELIDKLKKEVAIFDSKIIDATNSLENINNRYNNSLEKSNKIDEIYTQISHKNDILCGVDNDNSIMSNINKTKIQIDSIYEKLSESKNRVLGYKKKTRGDILQPHQIGGMNPNDYEYDGNRYYKMNTEVYPGIEDLLNEKIGKYQSFLQKDIEDSIARNKKINEDIEVLKRKIESHLPGATVAGLAFSYNNSQNKQFEEINFWKGMFFITILAMSGIILYFISKNYITFNTQDLSASFIQFLRMFSFEFPLIWLAVVSSQKISQFTRLHEEYQHKRTVAETFEGIRQIINDTKNENIKEHIDALLSAMLTSYSFNPSETLDKKVDSGLPSASNFNIFSKKDNVQPNATKNTDK